MWYKQKNDKNKKLINEKIRLRLSTICKSETIGEFVDVLFLCKQNKSCGKKFRI